MRRRHLKAVDAEPEYDVNPLADAVIAAVIKAAVEQYPDETPEELIDVATTATLAMLTALADAGLTAARDAVDITLLRGCRSYIETGEP